MELSDAIKKVKWSFAMKKELNDTKSKKKKLKLIEEIRGKDEPSQVYVTTCMNIVNGYCSLQEVELTWMAAMDFVVK